jgi:hypothetical protein
MTIYGYRIAVPLYTAGTGTISATTTALTGSGTNFDPQTPEGTIIHATASGQTLIIASVTDDTNAVLVTAPVTPISGAAFTYTPMVNLETLGLRPPKSSFLPWLESVDLGNGRARGAGRPKALWTWGFITRAHRDILRAFCTGKSAAVFIRTRKNDTADAYATYSAIMLWPDGEERDAGRRISFSVEFRGLVAL